MAETDQPSGTAQPCAVTVVIPHRNGRATIGRCLDAALRAVSGEDEIIVVDDGSTDGSIEIIGSYPCRLIRLSGHRGASHARNAGAVHARNEALFFIDADCLLRSSSLEQVRRAFAENGPGAVVGGSYTPEPADRDFYSRFQSVFIHYSEVRHAPAADYVASHAMAVHRSTLLRNGGFPERFLPIIEDVELSHRLRKAGCRLVMHPHILVTHVFNFTLGRSLRNGVRKSRYWTRYSLRNRDLFADSGTASRGLKTAVLAWLGSAVAAGATAAFARPGILAIIPLLLAVSAAANRGLLRSFWSLDGPWFGMRAAAYYLLIYPAAVAAGAALGTGDHWSRKFRRPSHSGAAVPLTGERHTG